MSQNHTISDMGAAIAEQFRELDAVIAAAKSRITLCVSRNDELAEPFIGKAAAAEFLNMSVSTLERRMEEKDGPPRYTDGGKVNFLRSELKSWRSRWRIGKP